MSEDYSPVKNNVFLTEDIRARILKNKTATPPPLPSRKLTTRPNSIDSSDQSSPTSFRHATSLPANQKSTSFKIGQVSRQLNNQRTSTTISFAPAYPKRPALNLIQTPPHGGSSSPSSPLSPLSRTRRSMAPDHVLNELTSNFNEPSSEAQLLNDSIQTLKEYSEVDPQQTSKNNELPETIKPYSILYSNYDMQSGSSWTIGRASSLDSTDYSRRIRGLTQAVRPLSDRTKSFTGERSTLDFSLLQVRNKSDLDTSELEGSQEFLENLSSLPDNSLCVDCSDPNPRWLSTLGIWLCADCADLHKKILGPEISNVRPIDNVEIYQLTREFLLTMGNRKAMNKWEYHLENKDFRPNAKSSREVKQAWIRLKYEMMQFIELKSGYVSIRAKKKWKRCWVSISFDSVNIYNEKGDKQPIDQINVISYSLTECPKTEKDHQNIFMITTVKKTFYVNAGSRAECIEWIFDIKLSSVRFLQTYKETSKQACVRILESNHTSLNRNRKSLHLPRSIDFSFDTQTLQDVILRKNQERELEVSSLTEQLTHTEEALKSKKEMYEELQRQLQQLEKECVELQGEQQSIKSKLHQLKPVPIESLSPPPSDETCDSSIVYHDDGTIKGGTVSKLVEALAHEKNQDHDFLGAFLLTYRSFTTPEDLLDKLILRFDAPPPEDQALFQRSFHLRLVNVLKKWLTKYFADFEFNPVLMNRLLEFLDTIENSGLKSQCDQLRKMIGKKILGKTKKQTTMLDVERIPLSILPHRLTGFKFQDVHPLEFARQMCLIEHSLYKAIHPQECLNQGWNKPDKEKISPNILACARRFNKVSTWVASLIVNTTSFSERVSLFERFIIIAQVRKKLILI
eukprot:TRINITY_DN4631_c0_g1_i1.p1 TRINITY_DN4631_c0_g1~~TRINITY_DN4631_c0_g1_i1.p1  ORF type:complete len:865 (+),score=156.13 TRINITY_DN4631_c0_g1_i1:38-2596(+)